MLMVGGCNVLTRELTMFQHYRMATPQYRAVGLAGPIGGLLCMALNPTVFYDGQFYYIQCSNSKNE